MNLSLLDWTVIAAYFLFNLGIGHLLRAQSDRQHQRVLSVRTQRALVARRHFDGRDDLCG